MTTPGYRIGILLAASMLVAVTACESKSKKQDPPADLVKFNATAKVRQLWSASVSGDEPKQRWGLSPAVDGETVFAAGHKGDVQAWNLKTGKLLWRTKTKLPLTAGPGAGEGLVVAGASHGDLVALDATTGAVRWKTLVNSELLSAPVMDSGKVLLRAVDGRLLALSAATGERVWTTEQQVPRLSLRGTARPAVGGGLVVSGFDNGRAMGVNLSDGSTAWDVAIAPPSGRTELERLIDIDSPARIVGDDVYLVTYQGRLARLARENGQLWWAREVSSYRGLTTDDDGVYVSTSNGEVIKIGRRTGVELWRSDVLARRRLSAPAVIGNYVAVADFDGYVHFLDAATGEMAARDRVGSERVSAPPLVQDGIVVFMNDDGKLAAFTIQPRESGGSK